MNWKDKLIMYTVEILFFSALMLFGMLIIYCVGLIPCVRPLIPLE